ncbi:MAG TPA: hypothetical protein VGR03_01255 [Candidatus Acidoferrum sp.]|nr:hypothetical protein [Candidatus Acidoferrum sp.]
MFDTGPLWELVLYSAVHTLRFESLKSELRHLRSDSSYQSLSEFVASFQRKTTTPHVVAEISSWIRRRTERKGQSAIWGLVYDEFSSMGMDEGVLKLLEMPQELVADMGAVDVSVLKLGLSLGQAKPLVLSIDSELIAECKRAGVNAKDLWEVIAEGIPQ